MLHGKKILLGVSGSIAAYKACTLVRLLTKAGAEVQVVLTPAALGFVTPLTLSALSNRPALSQFSSGTEGVWNNHVALGLWADALVIAPATAETLAHCANGLCNHLLQAVYLSARCPVFFAPAMDLDMYAHPAVQSNLQRLRSYRNHILEPGNGPLASGLEGEGRLMEPEEITERLRRFFSDTKPLAVQASASVPPTPEPEPAQEVHSFYTGKKVLITAGPTHEALDPVRYIGNHSSGKMGYALAAEAHKRGADVTLISGPTALQAPQGVTFVSVTSAADMEAAVLQHPDYDLAVLAAAVADYRPAQVSGVKIKKNDQDMNIALVKTPDIAAGLGARKKPHQLLAGFALETDNELSNAQLKLRRKNLDLIVLNSLQSPGAGFRTDTNQITIITRHNKQQVFGLKSKEAVAADILDALAAFEADALQPAETPETVIA